MIKKLKTYYQENRAAVLEVTRLIVVYKIILVGFAFLFYYFTYKMEKFDLNVFLNLWGYWDGGHYLSIAQNGYDPSTGNPAFYPLFPLLLRVFGQFFGYQIAPFLMNTVFLIMAALGMHALAKAEGGDESESWNSVVYLLIFPVAVFLSAIYTEVLFICLTVWIFYFVRKRNWAYASMLGILLGATRIESLAVIVFLVFEHLSEKGFNWRKIDARILYCFSPLLGLAMYSVFLFYQFGDPFLYLKMLSFWNRTFAWPWQPIGDYFYTLTQLEIATSHYYLTRMLDLFSLILAIIMGIYSMFRLRLSYAIFILSSALMVTFTSELGGTNRHLLILVPIYLIFGRWSKNRLANFIMTFVFSGLFFLHFFKFINKFWAG